VPSGLEGIKGAMLEADATIRQGGAVIDPRSARWMPGWNSS